MELEIILILTSMSCCDSKLKVFDLTHTIGYDTIHWPGTPPFNFTIISRQRTPEGFWLASNYFANAEHSGTHLDAPAHFNPVGDRISDLPLDRLMGPGMVIDIRSKIPYDPNYEVTIDDVLEWEEENGVIPDEAVVILNTGWFRKYPNPYLVFNTIEPENPKTFNYPGWHRDTARWLINERGINVLATDTPSNDCGQCLEFWVHQLIGETGICGLEMVANLDSIPIRGTMVYAPVIKLREGSGGPTRAFATIDDGEDNRAIGRLEVKQPIASMLTSEDKKKFADLDNDYMDYEKSYYDAEAEADVDDDDEARCGDNDGSDENDGECGDNNVDEPEIGQKSKDDIRDY